MKGKKMKFPFLFKSSTIASSDGGAWPWPTCTNNPKTLSFRHTTTTTTTTTTTNDDDKIYKTMNSAYYTSESVPQDSIFNITTSSFHIHHEEEEDILNNDVVLQGLRSERLFFVEPGETNSILEIAKPSSPVLFPYKESASIVAMDSRDPFVDFRVSMEEMVEAHNFKEWVCLEELLTCYLRVNEKSNHGYIVAAFVDLLLHLSMTSSAIDEHEHEHEHEHGHKHEQEEQCSSSNSTTRDYSFTSPLSFDSCSYSVSSTSPCLSSLDHNDQDEKKVAVNF